MKRGKASRRQVEADVLSDEAEMEVDARNEAKNMEDDDDDESMNEGEMNDEDDEEGDDDEQDPADDDEDDDEEGDANAPPQPPAERSEFLDAFYGLASSDARERAVGGQVILHHALLGPQANATDAAYALRRLLNGVCSGRAAARQGNASCLASFLKVAVLNGVLKEIQANSSDPKDQNTSMLAYVRNRLIAATSLEETGSTGRRKASEIKDNNFGRLFGVLAIVRSGILAPSTDSEEEQVQDILDTSEAYLNDLHALYNFKPYMREPAAHAVCTLVNAFFRLAKENNAATQIVSKLVVGSVIPLFLKNGDEGGDDTSPVSFDTFSAEQVALALNLQTNASLLDVSDDSHSLVILKEPVLTCQTIPAIASALAGTCTVNQPRTHLVWDTVWLYLTTESTSSSDDGSSRAVDQRILRTISIALTGQSESITSDNPLDILTAIMNLVVLEKLVGGSSTEKQEGGEEEATKGQSAHERRALALALVRNMMGVEFVSSLSGRTTLALDSDCIGSVVLQPNVIRHLLLDVVCAGVSGKRNQGDHLLKPVASATLDQLAQKITSFEAKLVVLKALVSCEPRFDGRTRTATVHDLLGLNKTDDDISPAYQTMWRDFIEFLQDRILKSAQHGIPGSAQDEDMNDSDVSDTVSPHEAAGLCDLMYNLAKRIVRIGAAAPGEKEQKEEEAEKVALELQKFRDSALQQIMSFMLAISFVHGKASEDKSSSSSKKKKKKSKSKEPTSKAVQVASTIERIGGTIPYDTRKILSSRFYSLLSDSTNAASHSLTANKKEIAMLGVVSYIANEYKDLEKHGYSILPAENRDDEDEDGNDQTSSEIVSDLLSKAQNAIDGIDETASPKDRFIVSVGLLASFLQLCLPSCNDPSEDQDVAEMADHEDVEEIRGLIEETKDCADEILGNTEDDEESNPLATLVALSINLLSSSFGESSDGARGASSKLTRELTKVVLSAGMMFLAKSSPTTQLDATVAAMVLQSVGVSIEDENDMEEEEEDGSDDDDDSENSETEAPFSLSRIEQENEDEKASKTEDDTEMEEAAKKPDQDTGDDEVMIDGNRLNSMLEDSDVDETELEHHEGADAALAKLLKLKQEARKAGQAAKERVELSQQIRCVPILELIVAGKPEGWGSLLRADIVMSMVPSLLGRWAQLEKKGTANASDPAAGERNALLNRLATFIKAKLLKSKMGSLVWTESIDIEDHCKATARKIMELAGRSSTEHQSCCYHSLPALFRSMPSGINAAASIYSEAVDEWSTKKSTRVDARLFEDLINSVPSIAQSILVLPLTKAAPGARSSFLKSECFRLIATLYNPKINNAANEQEKESLEKLMGARENFIESALSTLEDSEMQKAKRLKEVLRSIEKVVSFTSPHEALNRALPSDSLQKLEKGLKDVAEKTDSDAVKSLCESLVSRLSTDLQSAPKQTTSSKQNKKKKKKGKKKR